MRNFIFLLSFSFLLVSGAYADQSNDPKMKRLVGTWNYDRLGKWSGGSLTINPDMTVVHSKYGEGDLVRIVGDRYELTIYDNTGYEYGGSGQRCQLIIRSLPNGQLSVTDLNIGENDFDFYRCKYGLLTKVDKTPLIGAPVLPPRFEPYSKVGAASEAPAEASR